MTGFLDKPASEAGNLGQSDREMLRKLLSSPQDFPPEFKHWLVDFLAQELVPAIAGRQIKGRTDGSAPKTASFVTVNNEDVLTGERRLTAGSGITITDGGADGDITIAASGGGGGGGGSGSMVFLPGDTPEEADYPIVFPGPAGSNGVAGPTGPAGVGIPGIDGEDADWDWSPPGKDAVKGLFAIWAGTSLPAATGAFGGVWRVPYVNGIAKTFSVDRITLRFETAGGSGTYTVAFEKSAGGGAFVASTIGSLSLAAASNETSSTSSLGQLTSGQLIRINFTALGTGAATFTAQLEGTAIS